ncbi:MAG: MBL fold metallo-hydrolase [Clostridiales bacterium]|nr:MBL fold metallo-hydrolase [Clostridiales bacterium]
MYKVSYLHHSGFFVELESCCLLFDYWEGEIPPTPKKLYVFVSHSHGDHYNPEIFKLRENRDVTFILASEIRCKDKGSDIITIKPKTEITVDSVKVETLKSTDSGVAFIVEAEGLSIFHAGDLNLWLWKEETKQYNNNMKALFEKYISPLKGRSFDIGFIPLDPRQEEYYCLGMDRFLETADFKAVFPMHFWNSFDLIEKYRAERPEYASIIKTLTHKGQLTEV